jgi:hypothetical protein
MRSKPCACREASAPTSLLAAVVPSLLFASTPVLAATQAQAAALTPVLNPGAEVDASSWTGINATGSRSTTPVRSGAGSFAVQATEAGHAALFATVPVEGFLPGQAAPRVGLGPVGVRAAQRRAAGRLARRHWGT